LRIKNTNLDSKRKENWNWNWNWNKKEINYIYCGERSCLKAWGSFTGRLQTKSWQT